MRLVCVCVQVCARLHARARALLCPCRYPGVGAGEACACACVRACVRVPHTCPCQGCVSGCPRAYPCQYFPCISAAVVAAADAAVNAAESLCQRARLRLEGRIWGAREDGERERKTNGQRVHAWGKRQRETREGGEGGSERGREGGEERERGRERLTTRIRDSDQRLVRAARMRSRRQRPLPLRPPTASWFVGTCVVFRNFCGLHRCSGPVYREAGPHAPSPRVQTECARGRVGKEGGGGGGCDDACA